jgi:hypothetical protein
LEVKTEGADKAAKVFDRQLASVDRSEAASRGRVKTGQS